MMIVLLLGLATVGCTFAGGLVALRFHDKLHLILSYSAGAILGVAFFDLLPESLALVDRVYAPEMMTATIAVGFALFMVLDRLIMLHPHDESHQQSKRGILGASSLSFHSFLDGLAIGLAFQVSAAVGAVVAAAVLIHDFSDGINTVSLILKNDGSRRQAFRWLLLDALAPLVGVLVGSLFVVPTVILGIILALFCGFFLYIGASDLLPESYHHHPTAWSTIMTLLGMATLFLVVRVVV